MTSTGEPMPSAGTRMGALACPGPHTGAPAWGIVARVPAGDWR